MKEIRFHGRGGQGAQVASRLLGRAAFIEGNSISAFPFFGVERRGAPVTAFTRIDKIPIKIKSQIYEPNYVVVLDPSLLNAVDTTAGITQGGIMLINSRKKPGEIKPALGRDDITVATVSATDIASKHGLGSRMAPIVNTSMVGAFSAIAKLVSIDSVVEAIKMDVPRKREENVAAAKEAYENLRIEEE